MQIGEKIKNYRKTAGLKQEQVADYLDVSTPAVNKWEKGNTYPDISLLPAIARLLKIDMNELFSFREELTEKEIGQFVNELSEVSFGLSAVRSSHSTITLLHSNFFSSSTSDKVNAAFKTVAIE